MKNIISNKVVLVALSIILFSAAACKKYTEVSPVSTFDMDQAFSDPGNAFLAIIGAYDELSGESGFSLNLSMVFPYDSDEAYSSNSVTGTSGAIARYQPGTANSPLVNTFRSMYRGIERSNLCIEEIPKMALYTNGTDKEKADLKRLHGEALTLRAIFYLELIKNWGDVPAPMIPAYKQKDLFIPSSNRDSTYDKLINDLLLAVDLLPWRTQVARDARITKGAAKALLARIALFRGGYSLRASAKMERPADYLKYYQIALTQCSELMANRSQHTLNSNFETIWRDLNRLAFDPTGEIMLEMGSAGNAGASDSRQGHFNGPVLNSASRFGVGTGSVRITPNYFYAFDSVDTRRDVTITLYQVTNSTNFKTGRRVGELTTGKYRRDWRVPLLPGSAVNLSLHFAIIRFSDVLLMFAEASNEINNGPNAEAIAAFEEVRKRAYRGNTSMIGTTPTTKDAFFNAIVNERFLEFGDEGIRKYDLLRWNLLEAKIKEARTKINQIRDRVAPFAFVPREVYFRNPPSSEELQWFSSTNTSLTAFPFYQPTQTPAAGDIGTSTNPATKWVKMDWAQNLTSSYEGVPLSQNLARFFTPGKSELFPYDQVTLDAYQGKLKQNPGH